MRLDSSSELDAVLAFLYLHSINPKYIAKLLVPEDRLDVIELVKEFEERIICGFVEYDLILKLSLKTIYEYMHEDMKNTLRFPKEWDSTRPTVYVGHPRERRECTLLLYTEDPVAFAKIWDELEKITEDPLELMY